MRKVSIALVVLTLAALASCSLFPVKVDSITVTTGVDFSGQVSANTGYQVQFIATVQPSNATFQAVRWSVTNQDGSATSDFVIDSNGILTCTTYLGGNIRIEAEAMDGSGAKGTLDVTFQTGG